MSNANAQAAGPADRLPVLVLGALTAVILVAMVVMGTVMPTPSGPTGTAAVPPPSPPTTAVGPTTTSSFAYALPTPGVDDWTVVAPPGTLAVLTATAASAPAPSSRAPITTRAPIGPAGTGVSVAGAGSPPSTADAAAIQDLNTDMATNQKQAATFQAMGDDFAKTYYQSQSDGDTQLKLAQISLEATVAWTMAQMFGLHVRDDQQALAYDEGRASAPMTKSLDVAGHEMKVRAAKVVEEADALQEELDANAARQCANAYGTASSGPCAQQEQVTAADQATVNQDQAAVRQAASDCRPVGCTLSGETPTAIPPRPAPPDGH